MPAAPSAVREARRAWRWRGTRRPHRRGAASGEAAQPRAPSARGAAPRGRLDVDQRHVGARAGARPDSAISRPTTPGADDDDPVARARAGIPERVERRLHIGGEHGAARRQAVGHGGQRGSRRDEAVLVRVQREDGAPGEAGGPVLDHADRAVAVFHGEGKVALLQRARACAACSLAARGPQTTRRSVPRLMPDQRVRTTSASPGPERRRSGGRPQSPRARRRRTRGRAVHGGSLRRPFCPTGMFRSISRKVPRPACCRRGLAVR